MSNLGGTEQLGTRRKGYKLCKVCGTQWNGDIKTCPMCQQQPLPSQSPTEPGRKIIVCSVCGEGIKEGAPFSFTAKSIYCSGCYEPPVAQSPVPAGPKVTFGDVTAGGIHPPEANYKRILAEGVPAGEGTKPGRWRVGRKLGRTLYIGDRCIGIVDTPELAAEIVEGVNANNPRLWPSAPTSVPGVPAVEAQLNADQASEFLISKSVANLDIPRPGKHKVTLTELLVEFAQGILLGREAELPQAANDGLVNSVPNLEDLTWKILNAIDSDDVRGYVIQAAAHGVELGRAEAALTSVEATRNPWKEAVLDACSVNHLPWDENDPRKTMTELLAWERMVALNPKVSEEAAVRETMTALPDDEVERRFMDWYPTSNIQLSMKYVARKAWHAAYLANYREGGNAMTEPVDETPKFQDLKEIPKLRMLALMVTDDSCFTNAILAVTEAYQEGRMASLGQKLTARADGARIGRIMAYLNEQTPRNFEAVELLNRLWGEGFREWRAARETMTAERLAQTFHETYERLAPNFGYETRKESAKPWAEVPEQNKRLMIAVCEEVRLAYLANYQEGER